MLSLHVIEESLCQVLFWQAIGEQFLHQHKEDILRKVATRDKMVLYLCMSTQVTSSQRNSSKAMKNELLRHEKMFIVYKAVAQTKNIEWTEDSRSSNDVFCQPGLDWLFEKLLGCAEHQSWFANLVIAGYGFMYPSPAYWRGLTDHHSLKALKQTAKDEVLQSVALVSFRHCHSIGRCLISFP